MDEMWVSHVQVWSTDKDEVEIAARPLAYLMDQCLHKTKQINSFIVNLAHPFF